MTESPEAPKKKSSTGRRVGCGCLVLVLAFLLFWLFASPDGQYYLHQFFG